MAQLATRISRQGADRFVANRLGACPLAFEEARMGITRDDARFAESLRQYESSGLSAQLATSPLPWSSR
jgi:hypothetical protein